MNKDQFFTPSTYIFYLLVAFLITGCGDLKIYSNLETPENRLGKYRALEIADFETEIVNVPEEALTKIPDEVKELLASKEGGFEEVTREAIEDIPARDTLVLLGIVTEYQSGTDLKTEGGAIKFGESALTVQLSLVEEATAREISNGEVSGFSSLGLLRSGLITKGVYEGIAEEIVKFISENY
jgi:hypothetical protein